MTDFGTLFDEFRTQAFRFEAMPSYGVVEEAAALQAFINGAVVPTDWHDEWIQFLRDCARAGKKVRRVRVVPDPPTLYFEFELHHAYNRSIDAGEDIRGLKSIELTTEAAQAPDFWLFDDLAVCLMRYSTDGAFQSVDVFKDPDTLRQYQNIADELLTASKPISA